MSLNQAFSSRKLARQFHEEWITDVKRHVPPDRLLTFHVTLGWRPLCDFLGLPAPPESIPFPRRNEYKEIQSGILKMQIISWTILIAAPFATFAILTMLYCFIL